MVAREDLVAALPVEHDGEARALGRLHDEPLRDHRRRAERLVLDGDDLRHPVDELRCVERHPVRLDPGALDDRLRERALVLVGVVEERRERALAVADLRRILRLRAQQLVDGADDRGRVEPAGETRADRHVAAQPKPHRVDEQLPHMLGRVAGRRVALLERPVARDPQAALVVGQRMRRGQAQDPVEERLLGVVEVALRDVVADDAQVRARTQRREQGLRLAREEEAAAVERVVERLHAEPVPRREEPPLPAVPDGERPHAVEPRDGLLAPLDEGGEQDLRVGAGAEAVASSLELGPQFAVVVDLAVVDEPVAAVRAREGLHPRVGQVEDGEPAERERAAVLGEGARAVGASVVEARRHRLDELGLGRATRRDDSTDPAHQCSPSWEVRPQALRYPTACASAL